jgi:predicted transcriptional regulator
MLENLRDGDEGLPAVFRDAPLDDEPLTDEEIAAIEEARKDIPAGRVIPHEEVKRWLLDKE